MGWSSAGRHRFVRLGSRGRASVTVRAPECHAARVTYVGMLGGFMQAEQLKRGSIVFGQRVIGMRTGMVSGRRYVRVQVAASRDWSDPLFYGTTVAGTRPRTDLPAGPVGAGRGMVANRVGRGGDESPMDYAARRIEAISYGC